MTSGGDPGKIVTVIGETNAKGASPQRGPGACSTGKIF